MLNRFLAEEDEFVNSTSEHIFSSNLPLYKRVKFLSVLWHNYRKVSELLYYKGLQVPPFQENPLVWFPTLLEKSHSLNCNVMLVYETETIVCISIWRTERVSFSFFFIVCFYFALHNDSFSKQLGSILLSSAPKQLVFLLPKLIWFQSVSNPAGIDLATTGNGHGFISEKIYRGQFKGDLKP